MEMPIVLKELLDKVSVLGQQLEDTSLPLVEICLISFVIFLTVASLRKLELDGWWLLLVFSHPKTPRFVPEMVPSMAQRQQEPGIQGCCNSPASIPCTDSTEQAPGIPTAL